MVGLRYHLFGRSSARLEALSYFGKFYAAGQAKLRMDLSTRAPIYLEPVFTLHRWDHFSSFTTFFDEVRPSYIVLREGWGGLNAGLSVGNKGLLRYDFKYAQTRDSYYQQLEWSATDTADVTEFYHVSTGLMMERNSLNRKQHPNAGECLKAELRYFGGDEVTTPGTLGDGTRQPEEHHHEWLAAKVTLDKYFVTNDNFRFGFLLEGVYSSYPFFSNYTATIARAPVFQPTPESRTYFLENFRASQYAAGGARAIIALSKNRFDLRLEGYVFQPYKTIEREEVDQAAEGSPVSERYYLASGSLIYQSPIGPVWFNTSYIDGLEKPWAVSLNFGYVIFAQRVHE
jgi:NTE family protein